MAKRKDDKMASWRKDAERYCDGLDTDKLAVLRDFAHAVFGFGTETDAGIMRMLDAFQKYGIGKDGAPNRGGYQFFASTIAKYVDRCPAKAGGSHRGMSGAESLLEMALGRALSQKAKKALAWVGTRLIRRDFTPEKLRQFVRAYIADK